MRGFIGQRRMLERLGERAVRGDVAHAYLLSGPRSVGKRTATLRLAQTLACTTEPLVAGGCGTCLACRKVDHGTHPDVTTITRHSDKKDISIEQVRALQEGSWRDSGQSGCTSACSACSTQVAPLALRPVEGRARVAIIDDAAELNEFGQDALLKTLEEPPSHAVILLVTTAPDQLHQTIRSRAQPLAFRHVPTSEIAAALATRFGRDAAKHAAAAGGRPGVAIGLASDEAVRADRRALDAELYKLIASRLTERFAWAADLSDDPDPRRRANSIARRLAHWSELLRDATVAARGVADRPLRPELSRQTAALAGRVGAKELLEATTLLERLRGDLAWNANARAMLELIALRLPYVAEVAAA